MDFFFDNIAAIAAVLYLVVMFAWKFMSRQDDSDEDGESAGRPQKKFKRFYAPKKPEIDEQETAHSKDYDFEAEEADESNADAPEPREAEPDYDGARKLVEEMNRNATMFYGGASYVPDVSLDEVLKEKKADEPKAEPAKPQSSLKATYANREPAHSRAKKILADKEDLRRAIIASEILDKPKSLRDEHRP